jgi:SAM-dependent methyltransferase
MIVADKINTSDRDLTLASYFSKLLAEFLSVPDSQTSARLEAEFSNPGKLVAEAWLQAGPKTPDEITKFYQETDSYVYDLAADHCCFRRTLVWEATVRRIERRGPGQDVLLYGDGIGTDSIALARRGHRVTYFDLPGRTSEFARFRFARESVEDRITVVTKPTEIPAERFDAVVCIEVLEHVPDPPSIMRNLYGALKNRGIALITESFESVGPDYPSHLPTNIRYAGKTHRLMESLGFASTYYNSDPINRPMEFTKGHSSIAGDLLRWKGKVRRAVQTRWRYLTQ